MSVKDGGSAAGWHELPDARRAAGADDDAGAGAENPGNWSPAATIGVKRSATADFAELTGFPKCDEEVAGLTGEVWGDCDGKKVTGHNFGKGRVIWGEPLADVLAGLAAPPDFTANAKLNWIHRRDGAGGLFRGEPDGRPGWRRNATFE